MHENLVGALIEIGISVPGEMENLAHCVSPTGALLTNVGAGHLEALGSIEGVLIEKTKLFLGLPEGGSIFVNADDSRISNWVEGDSRDMDFIRYSLKNPNLDCGIENLTWNDGAWNFTIVFNRDLMGEKQRCDVRLPLWGKHNVMNALAAATVARYFFGISSDKIVEGLSNPKITYDRTEVFEGKTPSGKTVLAVNDTYNANPESMRALLDSAMDLIQSAEHRGKNAVLVFADMLELGAAEVEMHKDIGKLVSDSKIDTMITFGEMAKHSLGAASGISQDRRLPANTLDEVFENLKTVLNSASDGSLVFLKGSNSMELDKVAAKLKEWLQ